MHFRHSVAMPRGDSTMTCIHNESIEIDCDCNYCLEYTPTKKRRVSAGTYGIEKYVYKIVDDLPVQNRSNELKCTNQIKTNNHSNSDPNPNRENYLHENAILTLRHLNPDRKIIHTIITINDYSQKHFFKLLKLSLLQVQHPNVKSNLTVMSMHFGKVIQSDHFHIVHDCSWANDRCYCAPFRFLKFQKRHKVSHQSELSPDKFAQLILHLRKPPMYCYYYKGHNEVELVNRYPCPNETFYRQISKERNADFKLSPDGTVCNNGSVHVEETAVEYNPIEDSHEEILPSPSSTTVNNNFKSLPGTSTSLNSVIDCSENSSDSAVEIIVDGECPNSNSNCNWHKEKTKQTSPQKKVTTDILFNKLQNFIVCPLSLISRTRPWLEETKNMPDIGPRQYTAAIRMYEEHLCKMNFDEILFMHHSKNFQTIYSCLSGDVSEEYYDKKISTDLLARFITHQAHANNLSTKTFLLIIYKFLTKESGKQNCLQLFGPTNSGKTWFATILCELMINFGEITTLGSSCNPFRDCLSKNIIIYDSDKQIPKKYEKVLKKLFSGEDINVKTTKGAFEFVSKTPVVVSTSKEIYPNALYRSVMNKFRFIKFDFSDYKKKIHPLSLANLFEKHEIHISNLDFFV